MSIVNGRGASYPLGSPTPSLADIYGNPIRIGYGLGVTNRWLYTTNATGGGSGTVISVGVSVPTGFSVTGSPVTTNGTIAITTALTNLVKGTGSGFSNAVAGIDYQAPGNYVTALTGDVTASGPGSAAATLANTTISAGTYGSATQVAQIGFDSKGRATNAVNVTISGVAPGGTASGDLSGSFPSPTVAKINGATLGSTTATAGNLLIGTNSTWVSTSLSGDATLASSGAMTLANSGVTNGAYGSATTVPAIGVDAKGRITGATNVPIAIAQSQVTGNLPIASFDSGIGASGSTFWRGDGHWAAICTQAPFNATYITQTPDSTLTAEQALSTLATGYLKNTTGTGVLSVQSTPIPISDGGIGTVGAFGTRLVSGTSAAAWLNIPNFLVLHEEFQNGNSAVLFGGQTTSGTGTSIGFPTVLAGRPGLNSLNNGTTPTNIVSFRSGQINFLMGGGHLQFQASVRLDNLSDATDTDNVCIGFHDVNTTIGNAVDGVYFVYSSTNSYYTNTTYWSGVTSSNSSRTEVPSTVLAATNTWYKLLIDIKANGSQVDFYINDSLIGSATNNIPTGSGRHTGLCVKNEKVAGSTSHAFTIDYATLVFEPTTSR